MSIFSSSSNRTGVLTRDPRPLAMQQIQGKIVSVCCGSDNTFVITDEDELFGWGQGTGVENRANYIDGVHMPSYISAGANH